jgi:radical SAM superfamily enzyme YgiQ (UPF0313 family)
MNIALVFPESTFLIDPMVYPPLGLWYLAAHLEAAGNEVDFFDLSKDEFPNDGDFDQLWLSATSPQMYRIMHYGRVVSDWTQTKTVLGGAASWARLKECEDLGYDVVVSGEADNKEVIRDILSAPIGEIMQVGTRLGSVPTLPPVRRWSRRYLAWLEDREGTIHRTTTMFTSRGCPMACAFCESGRNGVIWDRTVRYEPIEMVKQQLREVKDMGFNGIMFYDDILPLNKPRMLEILDELKDLDMVWRCFIRTDVIEKQGGFEYLKQMADAGLVEVLAGVESADNRIKENVWKGTTIEQDTRALQWCKDLGIKFKASFILGLPGEDSTSMIRTQDWILKHQPDRADVNILIPFPGTPITSDSAQFDLYWTEDYPEEFWYKGPRDESNAVVGTSHLEPEEIQDFRNALVSKLEEAGIPY